MQDTLAAAVAALADPVLGREALHRPGDAGEGTRVRAVIRRPDRVGGFGESRIAAATVEVLLTTAEVPTPAAGDSIEVAGVRHLVQGTPLADATGLVWTLEARPA